MHEYGFAGYKYGVLMYVEYCIIFLLLLSLCTVENYITTAADRLFYVYIYCMYIYSFLEVRNKVRLFLVPNLGLFSS
jgi:hypothetical protein